VGKLVGLMLIFLFFVGDYLANLNTKDTA